ncbi:MAG: zinc-ribbon domain-containing protein [Candidatus Bathyarchaeota archaeon]|nr:zinc-ribbon domain-containing protein [Candidatus Bathyarchaeota archaeon]
MVTCTRCGTENKEGAKFCVKCGTSLYPSKRGEKQEETCFGPERRTEEECFGLPRFGAIAGLVFGAFIILIGVALLTGQDIGRWIGPFALIVFGILIVIGVIYGLSKRKGSE